MEQKLLTLENRLSFIESLELPELEPPGLAVIQETGKETANVDGGHVLAFASNVNGQNRSDVLNSCLLAQLAASKQYNHEEDTKNWYRKYSEVLSYTGWVMDEFAFEEYTSSSASFGVDTFMLNLLQAMGTGSEVAALQAAINFLRSLASGDPRSLIFSRSAHSGKKGNFQLSACRSENGLVSMSLGSSYFTASSESDNFFFLHFKHENSQIYLSNQTVSLDVDVYAQVRRQVILKLGDRASQYIADLDI